MNKNNKKDVTFYYERAINKDDLGDLEGAIEDFTKAIEIDSMADNCYYGRAYDKEELGDLQGAIKDYTSAIEINPYHVDSYLNRGVSKNNLGDYKSAIEDYTKVIEIDPTGFCYSYPIYCCFLLKKMIHLGNP